MATMGRSTTPRSRSTASSTTAGPTEQLTPTASTPSAARRGPKASGAVPYDVTASSPRVSDAMTGRSVRSRTAVQAASSSTMSEKVSRTNPSTPPARSPSTWRPNAATASAKASSPNGARRSPSGPTDPTTAARPATASRASRAAASLSASVSAARPWRPSFGGLAPKVFVSTSSAPASAYATWIRLTTSGRRTFSSSKQAESGTPDA